MFRLEICFWFLVSPMRYQNLFFTPKPAQNDIIEGYAIPNKAISLLIWVRGLPRPNKYRY